MSFRHIQVPVQGAKIVVEPGGTLRVPDEPVIAWLEGDGVGMEIGPIAQRLTDAAVAAVYGERRHIHWMTVYAGASAAARYDGEWYPAETLDAIAEFGVAIQGPLAVPIGGGFRSLNVALRQEFDLYAAVRPVAPLPGLCSPLRNPEGLRLALFRETAEDAYAAIEWRAGSRQATRVIEFLQDEMGVKKLRYADNCAIGIKPVSEAGCKRLVRRAIQHALDHGYPVVTLVHKGNVMRHTEGAFQRWGYAIATDEFGAEPAPDGALGMILEDSAGRRVRVEDLVIDAVMPELLTQPERFGVLAALNVNGDLLADTLVALAGTTCIAPCASLGDGIALFEVTHGPAEPMVGRARANPTSMLLAAEMMLRHIGWIEAAEKLHDSLRSILAQPDILSATDPLTLAISNREFGERMVHMLTK